MHRINSQLLVGRQADAWASKPRAAGGRDRAPGCRCSRVAERRTGGSMNAPATNTLRTSSCAGQPRSAALPPPAGATEAIRPEQRDRIVRDMFSAGRTWAEIAQAIGVSYDAVRQRAYRLGLRRTEMVKTRQEDPAKSTIRNRRYQQKFPEKRRAHKAVEWALLNGKLKREPCGECGVQNAHAHHADYSRPLEVRWLCPRCHKREHIS